MKKIIFLLLLLIVFSAFGQRVIVGENCEKGLIPDSSFTPFQLGVGFIDNAQLFDGSADSVVSFGLIGVGQKSAVLSCCPVINLLQTNYFLQSSGLIASCNTNWGISLAAIFNISQKSYGAQIGLVNATTDHYGLQIGVVNVKSKVQIGVFNSDGDIQFGLLNQNAKALIPWMPIFNFSIRK